MWHLKLQAVKDKEMCGYTDMAKHNKHHKK